MKKLMAAAALMLALLPGAAAAQVNMVELADAGSESTLVAFELDKESALGDMTRMAMTMQIEARFAQSAARELLSRPGAQLKQRGWLYQDEQIISMARIWQGDLAGGGDGCTADALTVNPQNGMEIYLDELFDDPEAAIAAMEAIIERDVLADMNTYLENSDLLPMPRSSFYADETGVTVFWPQERYAYFDGTCGYMTFYWHELEAFIGENSPVYAISRPQSADAQAVRSAQGFFGQHDLLALYQPLGAAKEAYGLTDEPDYTAASILYPLEDPALRGMAVEIAKYAQTAPEDTPICAVRHTRMDFHGLTTGVTTREGIIALMGEPDSTVYYGEDAAYDMLLDPGESLVYSVGSGEKPMVMEAHLNEAGVLACIILRDAMPETLY